MKKWKPRKRPTFTHVAKACGCWTRVYVCGGMDQLVCREHSILAPTSFVKYGRLHG